MPAPDFTIDLETESETPMAAITEDETTAKARQARNLNGTLVQSTPQPKPTKTPTKKLSVAAKTFRPERSRPVIGLDRWLSVARTGVSALHER
jgi:hypothetical protein